MRHGDADRRVEMPGTTPESSGRNPRAYGASASNFTARTESVYPETSSTMDAVVERDNLWSALRRVERNGGVAGVDNMPVEALRPYLKVHWPRIKEELLCGRYVPSPVLRVAIPKPGGKGMRQLGIPTVLDRFIQQALNQVMQPVFDRDFLSRAMASVRAGAPMMRCVPHRLMWLRAAGGSWIWTWSSSLTG